MIRKLDSATAVLMIVMLTFIVTANTVVAHEGDEHEEATGLQYTSELLAVAVAAIVIVGLAYWVFNRLGARS